MLEASLRGFLSDRLPMERRRAIASAGGGHDPELWTGLVAQGIAGLAVPERHGGAGLGVLDAAVAAESLGYHATPGAFAASLVMAPLALTASGTEAQQQEWLPRIAAGEARIAVGFASAVGQTGAAKVAFDGKKLSGRVQSVLDGGGATHVMVYLADGRPALAAVDAEGVRATLVPSLDRSRPLLDVTFEGAPAVVLSAANDPQAARTRVLDAGRVMLAADTLGRCTVDVRSGGGLRQGARAVRPRDRLVPGRQAHAGRSRHLARAVPGARMVCSPRPGRAARGGPPRRAAGQGAPGRRRPRGGPACPPRCTAAWASRTCKGCTTGGSASTPTASCSARPSGAATRQPSCRAGSPPDFDAIPPPSPPTSPGRRPWSQRHPMSSAPSCPRRRMCRRCSMSCATAAATAMA